MIRKSANNPAAINASRYSRTTATAEEVPSAVVDLMLSAIRATAKTQISPKS
ncbi:MAG: hypothetical protein JO165_02345 [Candidatus Eremiobacteraeota bacterium]|nr:hypothetical protein [Candidatus Eremiobacteraeota bacterium]